MNQDANLGLTDIQESWNATDGLWTTYKAAIPELSRADFWALAGIVAVERGAERGGTTLPEITFRYGRVDCADSPDDSQEFEYPDAAMDHDTMFAYMESHFGYDAQQTTAFMGAHALGNLHRSASGYEGTFTDGDHRELNNAYYSDMFDSSLTWTESQMRKTKVWQYDAESVGTRLHTDFELLYNIQLNDDESSSCYLSDCGNADTYDIALEYANVSVLHTIKKLDFFWFWIDT